MSQLQAQPAGSPTPGGLRGPQPPDKKQRVVNTGSLPKSRPNSPPGNPPRARSISVNPGSPRSRLAAKSNSSLQGMSKSSRPSSRDRPDEVSGHDGTMSQLSDQQTPPLTDAKEGSSCSKPSRAASVRTGGTAPAPGRMTAVRNNRTSAVSARVYQDRQNRRTLESQFVTKKRRYEMLKKDLVEKQKMIMETFTGLKELRDRLLDSGGKDMGEIDEVKYLEIGGEKDQDKNKYQQQVSHGAGEDVLVQNALNAPIFLPHTDLIRWLEDKLRQIPEMYQRMCLSSAVKRKELANSMESALRSADIDRQIKMLVDGLHKQGNEFDSQLEFVQKEEVKTMSELIRTIFGMVEEVEKMKTDHQEQMEEVQKALATAITEREEQQQQLQEQLQQQLQQQLELHQQQKLDLSPESEEAQKRQKELQEQLQDVHTEISVLKSQIENLQNVLSERTLQLDTAKDELTGEMQKNRQLQEKLNTQEAHLKTARQHMRELETKLMSDETHINQLNAQIKMIEEQLRMKDSKFDERVKEMNNASTMTNNMLAQLEKQREFLEKEVDELNRKLDEKNNRDAENTKLMLDLRNKVDMAEKEARREKETRDSLREHLEEERKLSADLMNSNNQLEMNIKKMEEEVAKHRQKEADLWSELETQKVLLQTSKGQVAVLEDEKSHLLDDLKKVTQKDDEILRMTTDLQQKNDEATRLKNQINELTAEAKIQHDKMEKHEKQIADLKSRLANANAKTAESSVTNNQVQELSQQSTTEEFNSSTGALNSMALFQMQHEEQVADLQASLTELVHNNEQLEQAVLQKQLEVEQRERVMREQSKVLKVRDELVALLKSKDKRQEEQIQTMQASIQDREKNNDKVRQIELLATAVNKEVAAKAEELQNLYQTLENKQQQVFRLERLVKQLEEQQERSQAQRTRHEARIAQLEMALQNRDSSTRYDTPDYETSAINGYFLNELPADTQWGANTSQIFPKHNTNFTSKDSINIPHLQTSTQQITSNEMLLSNSICMPLGGLGIKSEANKNLYFQAKTQSVDSNDFKTIYSHHSQGEAPNSMTHEGMRSTPFSFHQFPEKEIGTHNFQDSQSVMGDNKFNAGHAPTPRGSIYNQNNEGPLYSTEARMQGLSYQGGTSAFHNDNQTNLQEPRQLSKKAMSQNLSDITNQSVNMGDYKQVFVSHKQEEKEHRHSYPKHRKRYYHTEESSYDTVSTWRTEQDLDVSSQSSDFSHLCSPRREYCSRCLRRRHKRHDVTPAKKHGSSSEEDIPCRGCMRPMRKSRTRHRGHKQYSPIIINFGTDGRGRISSNRTKRHSDYNSAELARQKTRWDEELDISNSCTTITEVLSECDSEDENDNRMRAYEQKSRNKRNGKRPSTTNNGNDFKNERVRKEHIITTVNLTPEHPPTNLLKGSPKLVNTCLTLKQEFMQTNVPPNASQHSTYYDPYPPEAGDVDSVNYEEYKAVQSNANNRRMLESSENVKPPEDKRLQMTFTNANVHGKKKSRYKLYSEDEFSDTEPEVWNSDSNSRTTITFVTEPKPSVPATPGIEDQKSSKTLNDSHRTCSNESSCNYSSVNEKEDKSESEDDKKQDSLSSSPEGSEEAINLPMDKTVKLAKNSPIWSAQIPGIPKSEARKNAPKSSYNSAKPWATVTSWPFHYIGDIMPSRSKHSQNNEDCIKSYKDINNQLKHSCLSQQQNPVESYINRLHSTTYPTQSRNTVWSDTDQLLDDVEDWIVHHECKSTNNNRQCLLCDQEGSDYEDSDGMSEFLYTSEMENVESHDDDEDFRNMLLSPLFSEVKPHQYIHAFFFCPA